jgi:hypothetical protein
MASLGEYIATCEQPHEFIYECLAGRQGKDEEETISEIYYEVSADYGLHPDDEFERIIDIMVDQFVKDFA